jgi:hypothetical protein
MNTNNILRITNIIRVATELGYDIDPQQPFIDLILEMEAYILENSPTVHPEYCEVTQASGNQQSYLWSDGHGFYTECSGQIIDWHKHLDKPEGTRIYFDKFVDSTGKVVHLYDVVGKTHLNQDSNHE